MHNMLYAERESEREREKERKRCMHMCTCVYFFVSAATWIAGDVMHSTEASSTADCLSTRRCPREFVHELVVTHSRSHRCKYMCLRSCTYVCRRIYVYTCMSMYVYVHAPTYCRSQAIEFKGCNSQRMSFLHCLSTRR
jgi:hypothetical protein